MQAATERFRSEMKVHASRAVDAMKDGKPGDIIRLERMEEIIGRPCGNQTAGRGNVASAIKHVLRNYHVAWEWDRSAKGWRCLSSVDKLEVMPRRMKRARSCVARGMAIISTASMDDLTPDQRLLLKKHGTIAATVLLFSNPRSVRKLEQAGFEIKKPNMQKVIELMKRD